MPFEIGIGENDTAVEVVKENSHVFTPEPVLPEPEIPMPENKPEIPVKTPEAPVDKPILKPEITVPTGKPISKPEVTVPVEKPGMTDTPMIEPTVKPDTALKSDVKPMKLVKTGDQSEERFILLGGMLLLFGAVLLWYRKSVR